MERRRRRIVGSARLYLHARRPEKETENAPSLTSSVIATASLNPLTACPSALSVSYSNSRRFFSKGGCESSSAETGK